MNQRPLIIDTDTYNEIDDQFALAVVLNSLELTERLNSITIAPFDNVRTNTIESGLIKSYQTTMHILELVDNLKTPVILGADTFSSNIVHDSWTNIAAHNIALQAKLAVDKIDIVAIGALTNIYDALKICPEISTKLNILWLGANNPNEKMNEFNLRQDLDAVNYILNCVDDFVHFPCIGVVDKLEFDYQELRNNLSGNNSLTSYLTGLYKEIDADVRIIWDIAPVLYLLDKNLFSTAIVNEFYFDQSYGKQYKESIKNFIEVTSLNVEGIKRMFYSVLNNSISNVPIISPSLMCADWSNIKTEITQMEAVGIEYFHVDIMDGHYVPNMALGLTDLKTIRGLTTQIIDVHLMIANTESMIDTFIEIGVDIIYIHPETVLHINRVISKLKMKGIKVGIVLNPEQPFSQIEEYIHSVDYLLIMTVDPGFAGQRFIKTVDSKIKQALLYRKTEDLNFKLALDGAISKEAIIDYNQLGVDKFIVGTSFLFTGASYQQTMNELKATIKINC